MRVLESIKLDTLPTVQRSSKWPPDFCGSRKSAASCSPIRALSSSHRVSFTSLALLFLCLIVPIVPILSIYTVNSLTHANCRHHHNHHQPSQPPHPLRHVHQNNNSHKSPRSATGLTNARSANTHNLLKVDPSSRKIDPITHSAPCSDCVAIPLVAIMGNKQLNGFLIPQHHKRPVSARQGNHLKVSPNYHTNANYQAATSIKDPPVLYGYTNESQQMNLKPRSDEKCPMVKPMTVCDEINSYPADIILRKLDQARKVLKQADFNLNSLFSDEREHSSDPFDDSPQVNNNSTPSMGPSPAVASNGKHPQMEYHQSIMDPPQGLSNYVSKRSSDRYNPDTSPRYPQPTYESNTDDFVDIVEKQAISIESRSPSGDKFLDLADNKSTSDTLAGRASLSRASHITVGALKYLSKTHPPDPNQQSSGDNELLASKTSSLAQPNDNLTTRLRGLSPYSATHIARRSRRQISARVSASQQDGSVDPERVAASADAPNQVTPVCRAKSIYISPRAALNDKKQWRYVVNAPERNPEIRQIIRVDICDNAFGPCSDQVTIPFGFSSRCKQKYSKKKLLALNSQNGLLEVDTFFIPSCCVCQLVLDLRPPELNSDQDDRPEPRNEGNNEVTSETDRNSEAPSSESGESGNADENPMDDSGSSASSNSGDDSGENSSSTNMFTDGPNSDVTNS